MIRNLSLPVLALLLGLTLVGLAQKRQPVPHGQDRMPGPALSPAEAIKKMTVPEGFTVEVVASEPDLVNPVSMTFDEKGRIWVTESLEYPRRAPGPGKDRVKVLEDTDGDGKVDRVTVFAEGLNIPSGIAVGHGGVWVANSPDLLFYKIGDDGKAAGKPEVVVSGFGRDDTHELPNSLTWGPDGWLYGWNGVFNPSHIKQNGKEWRFTCAIFRIHPKTREFQLFCEGTSNPWGIAIDPEGSVFASACVIDHLWHLVETGYYHRQGGPYPPFTWKIGSIVRHKHQKAAYCGIHYFDSDAYPLEYRDRLYMGNIHGACINVDVLRRNGASYIGTSAPDFLSANDPWFMPVSQKTGPDGCLYILDWYDRYHCYQDANRDPAGIDRKNGRLYRVRYKDTPRAAPFDLTRENDAALIARLGSGNGYFRDLAQRLLTERLLAGKAGEPALASKLTAGVFDDKLPRKQRLHALFALVGGEGLDSATLTRLLEHTDATFRAWAVRAAGNLGKVEPAIRERIVGLARDSSPDVLLQVAVASRKIAGVDPIPMLVEVLASAKGDPLLPHIVWQNLHPLLEERGEQFVAVLRKRDRLEFLGEVLPRSIERLLAARKPSPAVLADLFALTQNNAELARPVLRLLAGKIQTGEVGAEQIKDLQDRFGKQLRANLEHPDSPLFVDVALLAATLNEPQGVEVVRGMLAAEKTADPVRLRALEALVTARDATALPSAGKLLGDRSRPTTFRAAVLSALGRLDEPEVGKVVLDAYPALDADLKPRAVELLAQRPTWARGLLQAVADKKIPASAINVNQARRLLASKDATLVGLVTKHWGTVREDRNPQREKIVQEMRALLGRTRGEASRGVAIYKKLCGQCHKLHGEGAEVGPDITSNGRANFDLLLNSVFDPSLVIGPGYQAVTVVTTRGRSLTGLLVEDSPARVVLKVQGGKQEIVARKDIEQMETSKLSLMPEDVEKQLKPQEIADLFALLCLDLPPENPKARWIPGTPRGLIGR